MNTRLKVFFLLALGIMGVYIIPSAVARYSGSHTWDVNESAGVTGVNCIDCHLYIQSELNATVRTQQVMNAHLAAAGNVSYTSGWLNLTIDNSTSYGVCQMCHLNQLSASSHTKTTVRACTDLDCHGDNASTNNTAYPEGSFGPKLGGSNTSNPTNVHMRIFNQASNLAGGHYNETGSDYGKGFYFCIGCHTQAEFEITKIGTESYNHSDFNAAKRRYL
ncbi:MAG: hypothetical protein ACC644_03885 [Candidatus Hydrothermarchaeales archaeon]